MTTAQLPVTEISQRAHGVKFTRVLVTLFAAIGAALGWAVGRTFVAVGWAAGRVFLTMAFFAEAVIYGFRSGAGLPPKTPVPPQPPGQ